MLPLRLTGCVASHLAGGLDASLRCMLGSSAIGDGVGGVRELCPVVVDLLFGQLGKDCTEGRTRRRAHVWSPLLEARRLRHLILIDVQPL